MPAIRQARRGPARSALHLISRRPDDTDVCKTHLRLNVNNGQTGVLHAVAQQTPRTSYANPVVLSAELVSPCTCWQRWLQDVFSSARPSCCAQQSVQVVTASTHLGRAAHGTQDAAPCDIATLAPVGVCACCLLSFSAQICARLGTAAPICMCYDWPRSALLSCATDARCRSLAKHRRRMQGKLESGPVNTTDEGPVWTSLLHDRACTDSFSFQVHAVPPPASQSSELLRCSNFLQ